MSHISYSGVLSPAIWLSFKGHKVAGAHADADDDYLYTLANECLYEWDISFNTGSRTHHLVRAASGSRRHFHARLNTYLNAPVDASVLNEILDAHDAGTLQIHVTCKVWYHAFFRHILGYIRRTSADQHNLADPSDPAPIRASFQRRGSGYNYVREERLIRDVPAVLSGFHVIPPASGSAPPGVKLYIYLKSKEELGRNAADEMTEILVAADYSKVNKFGVWRTDAWYEGPATLRAIEVCLETWERNVWQYFMNYADLGRGEKLANHVVTRARASGAGQADIIRTVRDELDKLVITANHWGQRREDRTTEEYQYHLSNLFGSIHQSHWRASPVAVIRRLTETHTYTGLQHAAFILQAGTGHCGEHATTSFAILQLLHDGGLSGTLGSFVKSGNANIDHAFVVGGIRPVEIVETTARNPRNGGATVGDTVYVWNLRDALGVSGPGVDGYVCDPYLAPAEIAQTARGLLAGLNSARKRSRGLDTDYLHYGRVYPAAPALSMRTVPSVHNV